jgi:VIT1/CCC1 family predicted Fe2+/Mn2+ transporter
VEVKEIVPVEAVLGQAADNAPMNKADFVNALKVFAPALERLADATAEKVKGEADNKMALAKIAAEESVAKRRDESQELFLSAAFGALLVAAFLWFPETRQSALPLATAVVGFISGRLTKERT